MNFLGAGLLFTNDVYMLAGYSPQKGITGLGGHREGNETPAETAFREIVEELFHISASPELVKNLIQTIFSSEFVLNDNFYVSKCSFAELERLMYTVRSTGVTSPLYSVFPTTVQDLIFTRKQIPTEHSHIVVLPYTPVINIDALFLSDIALYKHT